MAVTSGGQRVTFLEFLYGKPGVDLAQIADKTGILECLIRDAFDEVSSEKVRLHRQVADLETKNRDLQAYAQMVAHDLKEPLTVIITASELIGHLNDLTPAELSDMLRQISSTAFDMDRIIDNLLLLAEVRAMEGPSEVVDMERVVSNVVQHLDPVIKEREARVDLPNSWPAAIGYEPWVEEVWANYIANALRYGGEPPAVALGASPDQDGMVRFWTQDNGPGLPPQAQAQLFAPFTPRRKARKPGHGVGLSIVRQIVEKMGGQVGVESQIGRGSTFYFTLRSAPTTAGQGLLLPQAETGLQAAQPG